MKMKQTTSKSKLVRAPIWIGGILGGLILVFAIYTLHGHKLRFLKELKAQS